MKKKTNIFPKASIALSYNLLNNIFTLFLKIIYYLIDYDNLLVITRINSRIKIKTKLYYNIVHNILRINITIKMLFRD